MKTTTIIITTIVCCFFYQQARAYFVIDQADRRVDIPERLSRIVSLAPSVTEMIYSLGKEKLLVGATQYSNHPEAAKNLPRVGSYVRLDIEKIVALKPDLCIAIKDGNPEHTVKKIESFNIPVYVIDPRNLNDIINIVGIFGKILAAEQQSTLLINEMRRRLRNIQTKIATVSHRPKVFFQIDAAPIITVGNDTFIHELITLAGGINVAAGPEPYPRYNWEQVLMLQPEIALVASMAGGHTPEELKAGWMQWPQIPAVKQNRIHVVDADLIDRPTPRLLDGLEEFARIIHPEIFNGQ
jgi:iron complex transport system substrate-binding protein